MVIREVGTVRLEVFGLDDDMSPLELVTTCTRCGARLAHTRYVRDGMVGDVETDAEADAGIALAHRC